jgi:hypothetical protein
VRQGNPKKKKKKKKKKEEKEKKNNNVPWGVCVCVAGRRVFVIIIIIL